jgi:hypothetical protein
MKSLKAKIWTACTKPENERLCICVLVVSIMPLSTSFLLVFRILPTVWYFFVLHFIIMNYFFGNFYDNTWRYPWSRLHCSRINTQKFSLH